MSSIPSSATSFSKALSDAGGRPGETETKLRNWLKKPDLTVSEKTVLKWRESTASTTGTRRSNAYKKAMKALESDLEKHPDDKSLKKFHTSLINKAGTTSGLTFFTNIFNEQRPEFAVIENKTITRVYTADPFNTHKPTELETIYDRYVASGDETTFMNETRQHDSNLDSYNSSRNNRDYYITRARDLKRSRLEKVQKSANSLYATGVIDDERRDELQSRLDSDLNSVAPATSIVFESNTHSTFKTTVYADISNLTPSFESMRNGFVDILKQNVPCKVMVRSTWISERTEYDEQGVPYIKQSEHTISHNADMEGLNPYTNPVFIFNNATDIANQVNRLTELIHANGIDGANTSGSGNRISQLISVSLDVFHLEGQLRGGGAFCKGHPSLSKNGALINPNNTGTSCHSESVQSAVVGVFGSSMRAHTHGTIRSGESKPGRRAGGGGRRYLLPPAAERAVVRQVRFTRKWRPRYRRQGPSRSW